MDKLHSNGGQASKRQSLLRSLGPGFITAAVVIGPGSITVASKIGAAAGMRLLWVIVIAGSFMMLFTSMSARIGVLNKQSLLTLVATYYGRWLAVLMGLLAFVVCASFQMGNYLACATALGTLTEIGEMVWMAVVGLVALVFVFAARRLYQAMEKVMLALVVVMLAAFVGNLVVARPDPLEALSGLVPRIWPPEMTGLIIAMLATTFSVIAALYQSTMAQQKGWTADNLRTGLNDSLAGIGVLLGISMIITMTSATVLRGATIDNAAHLSAQLEPLLGYTAVILFSLGFLAASFSSTVVNAMIGGGLLADSLGMSSNINALPARIFTALGMGVGMAAGIYTLLTGTPIEGIVLAQKTTILAVPLCALVMIILANDRRVVGEYRNSLVCNVWTIFAFLALVAMSIFRAMEILRG